MVFGTENDEEDRNIVSKRARQDRDLLQRVVFEDKY